MKLNLLQSWGENWLSLLFPQYCPGCGKTLGRGEIAICYKCLAALPRTGMHDLPDNPIEKILWGRAEIESATAFLRMAKQSAMHRIVHDLKYHGNQEAGTRLGQLFGAELAVSRRMRDIHVIVPVPLHPKKQRARGYNQCHCIGEGLRIALRCEMDTTSLIRTHHNASQTSKHRYERWQNVGEIFRVANTEKLKGKHILLVDDIITTGATIEACVKALSVVPDIRVSVAALAIPSR
ncbi:MAG: ComF family protein [Flavobacteriales bacterium]|nr:ComF family protein [Flavobacteriales bacterium]